MSKEADDLAHQCCALYQQRRFDEGIALAQRVADCEQNFSAQLQIGVGLLYKRQYADARQHFQRAVSLSPDAERQAECLANIGTAYLEELEVDQAEEVYHRAVAVAPRNVYGLLGLLSVACAREDLAAVERACRHLVEQWPNWQEHPIIVRTLANRDRSLRFLLDEVPECMEKIFGVPPTAFTQEA